MSVPNYARRPSALNLSGPRLVVVIVILVVAALLVGRLFKHHENTYEQLARNVTIALQKDDVDAVKKYQNAETATTITRGVVGRLSDRLAPLGKLNTVKETTPSNAPDQIHDFDLAFDKGTIHETMKVGPGCGPAVEWCCSPHAYRDIPHTERANRRAGLSQM